MPVVETRHYNGIYQSVSTKLLAKQGKKGAKNETSVTSTNSKKTNESIGKTSQKKTVKEIFERQTANATRTSFNSGNYLISSFPPNMSIDTNNEETRCNSIVSGSQKLKDLQELHRQLSKSSYEPPIPLGTDFTPRKPTMEAIKSAIGKAKLKQLELASNKSVGTDDERVDVLTADASTSTNQSKGKKKKMKTKKTSGNGGHKKTKKKKNIDHIQLKTKIKVNKEDH